MIQAYYLLSSLKSKQKVKITRELIDFSIHSYASTKITDAYCLTFGTWEFRALCEKSETPMNYVKACIYNMSQISVLW